jgi:predicted transposase/invertase (TIGR01784 family)
MTDAQLAGKKKKRKKHDSLFRKALENPIAAREFLTVHLPPAVLKLVDLENITLEKESFIEKNLKSYISDVLFSTKIANKEAYIFVLAEHQSKPDPLMAMRLMRYMLSICERYAARTPKGSTLPLVYPLVVYNGREKYTAKRNFWDLCSDGEMMRKFWNEEYQLIDLNDIPDEELKKHAWVGTLEFFLKYARARDLLQKWREIAGLIPELIKVRQGYDYLEIIMQYTLIGIEKNDKIELENLVKSYLTEEESERFMVSLAKHWEQEGFDKGKEEGINEGIETTAVRMIEKGADLAFISGVTGISVPELRALQLKVKTSN